MDFLVRRPVAVCMATLAMVILGIVAYMQLPVSLLPDIDIPQITVRMTDPSASARELEQSVVGPMRRRLLQVGGLEEIRSTVRDGVGRISLRFEHGVNTDLAYIEVNEKIDGAMNSLGSGVARPQAIKASATDVPVFYLNVTLADGQNDEPRFLEMCDAVENVIRRRIEQLPEVAMADVTGIPERRLVIVPDANEMKLLGLTMEDIDLALSRSNVDAGSMVVNDGYQQYTIRATTLLRDADDVRNIYVNCHGRLVQLKDFCRVAVEPRADMGRSLVNGHRAVTIAVIKQSEEGLDAMRGEIERLVAQFGKQFPELRFEVSRDQTELLEYTMGNLKQNLALGFAMIIVIAILFLGNWRSAVVISVSMLVAVILTFCPFAIFGRSLNIISLSGLILVVGMMIDNAIIVSEDIVQWRRRGHTLRVACVGATREMVTPMLSSMLTTVAIFVPLVFVDGMAGSVFADQAFAITVGLVVSYAVGILFLPVLQKIVCLRAARRGEPEREVSLSWMVRAYDAGISFVQSHRAAVLAVALSTIPLCALMAWEVGKDKMPAIATDEVVATIDWNDNVTVEENSARTLGLIGHMGALCKESSASVGAEGYIMAGAGQLSASEVEIYCRAGSPDSVGLIVRSVEKWLSHNHPEASVSFAPPSTLFEQIFNTGEPELEVRLTPRTPLLTTEDFMAEADRVAALDPAARTTKPRTADYTLLTVDRERLTLYNVTLSQLRGTLAKALNGDEVTTLRSYSQHVPVCVVRQDADARVENLLRYGSVRTVVNREVVEVPLRSLLRESTATELKEIESGKDGEYLPVAFWQVSDAEALCKSAEDMYRESEEYTVSIAGSYFSSRKMLLSLGVVLVITILLVYFILCAQFESFSQPLVVLAEIPIDTFFAILVLWLCGETLNLMSGIGIIVSCGVIVNDSILKLNTINDLRRSGLSVADAIHTAGHRRLRAIVMTTLTTVGAMLPVLFTADMGSELQRPLAIAMIATMTVGTLVSLFVVPLLYAVAAGKRKN